MILNVTMIHKICKKFIIKILNESISKNVKYLALIIPVFLGLAFIGNFILGPFSDDYTSLSRAFISVMLFTVGRVCKYKINPQTPYFNFYRPWRYNEILVKMGLFIRFPHVYNITISQLHSLYILRA